MGTVLTASFRVGGKDWVGPHRVPDLCVVADRIGAVADVRRERQVDTCVNTPLSEVVLHGADRRYVSLAERLASAAERLET